MSNVQRISPVLVYDDGDAAIELLLAEKGFGTNVTIEARGTGGSEPAAAALEELLDELSSPQKRPFARG